MTADFARPDRANSYLDDLAGLREMHASLARWADDALNKPTGLVALRNNRLERWDGTSSAWSAIPLETGWIDLGHVPTQVTTTRFRVPGDMTADYRPGRRVRAFLGSTALPATITASAYVSAQLWTTVDLVLDGAAVLSGALTRVELGFDNALFGALVGTTGAQAIQGSLTITAGVDGLSLAAVGQIQATDLVTVASGSSSVTLTPSGSVEIQRSGGGWIDWKDSPGEDYDVRLAQAGAGLALTGDALTVVGGSRAQSGLALTSDATGAGDATVLSFVGPAGRSGSARTVRYRHQNAAAGGAAGIFSLDLLSAAGVYGFSPWVLDLATVRQEFRGSDSQPRLAVNNGYTTGAVVAFAPANTVSSSDGDANFYVESATGDGSGSLAAIGWRIVGRYSAKAYLRSDGFWGLGGGSASAFQLSVNLETGALVAAGTITQNSDRRLKRDVTVIADALALIERLRGVRFVWAPQHEAVGNPGMADLGMIAQEVAEVVPELVVPTAMGPAADPYLALDYGRLVSVMVEAVKELTARVRALEAAAAR